MRSVTWPLGPLGIEVRVRVAIANGWAASEVSGARRVSFSDGRLVRSARERTTGWLRVGQWTSRLTCFHRRWGCEAGVRGEDGSLLVVGSGGRGLDVGGAIIARPRFARTRNGRRASSMSKTLSIQNHSSVFERSHRATIRCGGNPAATGRWRSETSPRLKAKCQTFRARCSVRLLEVSGRKRS